TPHQRGYTEPSGSGRAVPQVAGKQAAFKRSRASRWICAIGALPATTRPRYIPSLSNGMAMAPCASIATSSPLPTPASRPSASITSSTSLLERQPAVPQARNRLPPWPSMGLGLAFLLHPVLILWGSADTLNLPQDGEALLRAFPDAHLFAREKCGHWPSLEARDWVDLKMRAFLLGLSA